MKPITARYYKLYTDEWQIQGFVAGGYRFDASDINKP